MSTKLREIQVLALRLLLLVSLVVSIQARAASPALDEQIIADAYAYLNHLGAADFVNPTAGGLHACRGWDGTCLRHVTCAGWRRLRFRTRAYLYRGFESG